MALTARQRMLLHLIVRRFDRESNTAYLDPLILEQEMGASLVDLAEDVDVLETEGYVQRVPDDAAGDPRQADAWVLTPTDRGVMAAMGLE